MLLYKLDIILVTLQIFVVQVTGITFTSTNPRYVIGESGTLALRCSVTESDATTVYVIKIKRAVSPGSNTDELLASFVSGTAQFNDQITNDRDFAVEGSLSDSPPYLQISMNIQKMTCNDARMYKCGAGYDSSITGQIETPEQNITLQAFVKPRMTSLIGTKNNQYINGGSSTSDKAQFDAGDVLELSCKAKIGSFDTTKIRWRKTSETGSGYIGYQPAAGSFTEGTAFSDNQCGYDRTATITYNTSNSDASYDLAFECYVSVIGYPPSSSTPGGSFTTTNNLQYHLEVTSSTDYNTGGVASAGQDVIVIVSVSVSATLFIIAVVTALVILRRRKYIPDVCIRMAQTTHKSNTDHGMALQDEVTRPSYENIEHVADVVHSRQRHYCDLDEIHDINDAHTYSVIEPYGNDNVTYEN